MYRVLIRPHPAIWRLVHGLAVIYLVSLTFLLFQVCFLSLKLVSLLCWAVQFCCKFSLKVNNQIFTLWICCVSSSLPFGTNLFLLILGFYFYCIIQKRDDARQFMKFLHRDLGVGNSLFLESYNICSIYFFKHLYCLWIWKTRRTVAW